MAWLGAIGHRSTRDSEIDKELRFHIEHQIDDYMRAGMPPEEARRRTHLEFGGLQQITEECRDVFIIRWWDDVVRDVQLAIRGVRRSPGFFAAAVATLALGIGADTTIFSVVDGALLHPIPFAQPDRLVTLYGTSAYGDKAAVSYPNFIDWQREAQSFEELAAWRSDSFTLSGRGQAETIAGLMVSANLLSALQVQPIVGRTFRPEEDRPDAAPTAMLGEEFWVHRFDRDPHVAGRSLVLDGRAYTVIGVVPANVRLERTAASSLANDVFVPIGLETDPMFLTRGVSWGTRGLGRLRSGISITQAQAEMSAIAAALASKYPGSNPESGVHVLSLQEDVVGDLGRVLWMLLGAVGFLLVIVCANVASLVLARSADRSQEFAVRRSLGAWRGRLVRQLLTESVVLAVVGGVLGIVLAVGLTRVALDLLPSALPALSQVALNARVLAFALAISVATGLLCGLAPARHASRPDIDPRLRARGRGFTERSRAQRALVVGQIALTLVLLIGCGLMVRSIVYLLRGSVGFDSQRVMIMRTGLSAERRSQPDSTRAALANLNDRFASVPGVETVSLLVGSMPFTSHSDLAFWEGDAPPEPGRLRAALYSAVGRDYFRTLRIPVLRGRSFTPQDDVHHPLVVIVDQELASSVFGSLDVIGRHIHTGLEQTLEIIGVVGHVAHQSLDVDATGRIRSQMYVPIAQLPDRMATGLGNQISVVVRSGVSPASLFPSLRAAVSAFDSGEAVHDQRTMDDAIAAALDGRRFSVVVLGLFAISALLLSTIGIVGLVSYGVSRRAREIGIHLALGASRRDILSRILRDGGRLTIIGTLLGLTASVVVARLIASLLFRVSPGDPLTFGGVTVLLMLVMLAATSVPARRAARLDPAVTLRSE